MLLHQCTSQAAISYDDEEGGSVVLVSGREVESQRLSRMSCPVFFLRSTGGCVVGNV